MLGGKVMTVLKNQAIKLIEIMPEEYMGNIVDFLQSFLSKSVISNRSQLAYQNLQKYRKKGNIDIDYKKELTEIISEEYENID